MKTAKSPGGRPRRPVNLTEVPKLLTDGLSLRQTARRLSLSHGTVHKALQDAGGPSVVIQNSRRGIL